MYVLGCNDDANYCIEFPPSPTATPGAPQPSLCLAKPEGCGAAGGACCPLTGDKQSAKRCVEEGTLCLAPTSSGSIYGDLTYEMYLLLKAAPDTPLPNATALSVWGLCQAFDKDECGELGGLCGSKLPKPAPQCPESKRTCVEWCVAGHTCSVACLLAGWLLLPLGMHGGCHLLLPGGCLTRATHRSATRAGSTASCKKDSSKSLGCAPRSPWGAATSARPAAPMATTRRWGPGGSHMLVGTTRRLRHTHHGAASKRVAVECTTGGASQEMLKPGRSALCVSPPPPTHPP